MGLPAATRAPVGPAGSLALALDPGPLFGVRVPKPHRSPRGGTGLARTVVICGTAHYPRQLQFPPDQLPRGGHGVRIVSAIMLGATHREFPDIDLHGPLRTRDPKNNHLNGYARPS